MPCPGNAGQMPSFALRLAQLGATPGLDLQV
jgi:hypothetical protein